MKRIGLKEEDKYSTRRKILEREKVKIEN